MLKALTGPISDLKAKREEERKRREEEREAGGSRPYEPNPSSKEDPFEEHRVAKEKRERLDEERAGLRLWRTKLLFLSFILPIVAWLWLLPSDNDLGVGGDGLDWKLVGVALFIEAFFVVSLLAARTRLLTIRTELQRVEYETLLLSLPELEERIAANLFFKHQFELKQYYDQALRQHRQAFALGVTCVLFGLGVVAVAILVVGENPDGNAEVVIAILGAVGALLSGTVASIYLTMYAGATQSLQTFHQRLVKTNRMHLAYLFATTIKDDALQMSTLEKLAEHTVTTNDEVAVS